MFLSSVDSIDSYANNLFDSFIVELDKEIILEEHGGLGFTQTWTVALTELSLDPISVDQQTLPESVIVSCDLVAPSYINGTGHSLLRTLPASSEITSSLYLPYYMTLGKLRFSCIRIELRDSKLDNLQLAHGWKARCVLKCTLHFLRN